MPRTTLKEIRDGSVVDIDLTASWMSERSLPLISEALKQNKTAEEIQLDLCGLSDGDFEIIVDSLLNHPKLKRINLSNNDLTNVSFRKVIGSSKSFNFRHNAEEVQISWEDGEKC